MKPLRGTWYDLEKEATGFEDRDLSGGQNDPRQKTAEIIAKKTGVSPRTIKRDAQFAVVTL